MKREDFQFRAGEKAVVRLNTEVRIIDEDKRIVEYIGSDESIDRYGTSLRGWNLKQYRRNPVFLYGHDHYFPPIGAAKRVWLDPEKNLRFRIQYVPEELFPFAGFVFKMVQGRWIRATSVGFIPDKVQWPTNEEYEADNDAPVLLLNNELLELSQVTVPANPNALANAFRSLKPSDEYAGYISANAKLPHEGLIDGRDSLSLRDEILGWSRDVQWDGEIEDESVVRVAVHPDSPVGESADGDVAAPDEAVEPALVEPVEPAPDDAVVEPVEAVEPGEPEVPVVVVNAAPTFTVSWDAVGAGMARLLLGDYEDDDPEDEFRKLVAGYASHEKGLPAVVLPSGETRSIADVAPEEMEGMLEQGAVEVVFHHGEDAMWAAKRSVILGDRVAPATPAAIAPDLGVGGAPVPSFGAGGGGGSVSRAPKSWSGQKPDGGTASGGLSDLRAQLATLRGEVLAMQDQAEDIEDVRAAISDLDADILELDEAISGEAADIGDNSLVVEAIGEAAALNAEGADEGDPGDLSAAVQAVEDPEDEEAPTPEAPAPAVPSDPPAIDLEAVREMVRAEIAAGATRGLVLDSDTVSPSDLADIAFALGVVSWFDFRADGRTCADYVRALADAAGEMAALATGLIESRGEGKDHTRALAGEELSMLLRRLDGIEAAVKAAPVVKTRTAGALLASRRGASEEVLGESLDELATAVMDRVAAAPGRRQPPPLRKRNGRQNWWGVGVRPAD